jgi:hypothetical protein
LTEEGREMECNDEQSESALLSIRSNFEFDSNVNDTSEVQVEKQSSPTISIDAGRQIDRKPEQ